LSNSVVRTNRCAAFLRTSLIGFLAGALGCASLSSPGRAGGSLSPKASLSPREKSDILRLAYALFDTHGDLPASAALLQETLNTASFEYSVIYTTFYGPDGQLLGCQGASPVSGKPPRLGEDTRTAVLRTLRDPRFDPQLSAAKRTAARVVINILHRPRPARRNSLEALARHIEPGIHAIAIQRGRRRAVFKESVPISSNYSLKRTLERLSKKAGLRRNGYLDPRSRITTYETVTFTGDREGRVTDLYRYNVLVPPEAVTQALLQERLALAGDWFSHNINARTGLLEYQYDPARDRYATTDNHIRRLACIWAMAKWANQFHHKTLRASCRRMVDFYRRFEERDANGGVFLSVDGKAPIAHGAFLILALSELPDYPNRDALIRQLAQGLLNQQNSDGAYRTIVGQPGTSRGIDYYPGESMLALMHAYRLLQEPAYLASVERAFPFYRAYWRRHRNTAFVPWHSQVNLLLYQATRNPSYADFTFEMTDWLIDQHQLFSPRYPDELGGFAVGKARKPRNSTSSYLEGLNAAYRLATLVNDQRRTEQYARSIRLGTRFILQTQMTAANAFYLKNPQRAIGGFTQSLTRIFQRNDYTQHAVMALLAAEESGLLP
jgi:AMMECR1 domain-containing protein